VAREERAVQQAPIHEKRDTIVMKDSSNMAATVFSGPKLKHIRSTRRAPTTDIRDTTKAGKAGLDLSLIWTSWADFSHPLRWRRSAMATPHSPAAQMVLRYRTVIPAKALSSRVAANASRGRCET